ncbi:MAG: hypothetical protein AAF212_06285 [Verrucomicrobiota bacterium]
MIEQPQIIIPKLLENLLAHTRDAPGFGLPYQPVLEHLALQREIDRLALNSTLCAGFF